jgi:hypothetical protein
VTHQASNPIAFKVLGLNITITNTGLASIQGGDSVNLASYQPLKRLTIYIKIFNTVMDKK